MEIVKRVKRYSKSLGTNNRGHNSFINKLTEFEKFSSLKREEKYIKRLKRGAIQKEMSCILLLHYINEIKDFFTPSSSGFLFESFIAGLIPYARVKEDNSPVDIRSGEDRYQLKLLDFKTEYIPITFDTENAVSSFLEYYLIALKFIDKIQILIIDGKELERRMDKKTIGDIVTAGNRFKVNKLLTSEDKSLVEKFTIDLTDIEGRIANLGQSLKKNLEDLYNELSDFQYNIETIITGTDQKGRNIKDPNEFDVYHNLAERNIDRLKVHLENLVTDINK
jgi:hypothetical protein